ncbi:MAG: STAS domain-containing protein [Pseudomonadota bacterium]
METRQDTPDTAEPGDAELMLGAKLDLRASTELVDQIGARRGHDLVVNASGVEHLGAHALQTLMTAAKTWAADGHSLRVTPLSDAMAGHLATFGLTEASLQSGDVT